MPKSISGNLKGLPVIASILLLFFAFTLPVAAKVGIIKDQDYFFSVQDTIRGAKNSIKIIVFKMEYYPEHPLSPSNILIQDLIEAEKRGVNVRVILDVSDWNPEITKTNKRTGRILSEGGVKVRYDSPERTTHTKLVLVDDSLAILGSNNWTYYSLTKNKELAALITDPPAITELSLYFDKLWAESR